MQLDEPNIHRQQVLGTTTAGMHHRISVLFDHDSDNYEILVNNDVVWGSNGRNLDHETVETITNAIVRTLNWTKAD